MTGYRQGYPGGTPTVEDALGGSGQSAPLGEGNVCGEVRIEKGGAR